MDKQLVVVSRKWHEPFIRVDITSVGIGITMTLEDFIAALEIEVGHPVSNEAERIISGMKQETARVL